VFFSLFSEAEPFAAILIAHGTHVFFWGLLRPEGPKFEATCRERGGVLGEGAASPLPISLKERCKLPQLGVWGRTPIADTFWTY